MSRQRDDDIVALAMSRWHQILPELGVSERHLTGKHCPCPICGGKDRFRYDNKDGRGTWICSQCGAGDGFDLLIKTTRQGFNEIAQRIRGFVETIRPDTGKQKKQSVTPEQQRRACKQLWAQSDPIRRGDPADRYLRARGLALDVYPPDLRIVPELHYRKDGLNLILPCMVAAVREPAGAGCQVHRTFLAPDCPNKADVVAPRMLMPGEVTDGAAVRLAPAAERMGVAEGIETALAAMQLFQLPVWACLTTSLLAKWQPPSVAREVYIFADADPGFGGQYAAYALAKRLVSKKLTVRVEVPTVLGIDWNDILKQRDAA